MCCCKNEQIFILNLILNKRFSCILILIILCLCCISYVCEIFENLSLILYEVMKRYYIYFQKDKKKFQISKINRGFSDTSLRLRDGKRRSLQGGKPLYRQSSSSSLARAFNSILAPFFVYHLRGSLSFTR